MLLLLFSFSRRRRRVPVLLLLVRRRPCRSCKCFSHCYCGVGCFVVRSSSSFVVVRVLAAALCPSTTSLLFLALSQHCRKQRVQPGFIGFFHLGGFRFFLSAFKVFDSDGNPCLVVSWTTGFTGSVCAELLFLRILSCNTVTQSFRDQLQRIAGGPVLSLGVTGQRRHPQGGVKTYLLAGSLFRDASQKKLAE